MINYESATKFLEKSGYRRYNTAVIRGYNVEDWKKRNGTSSIYSLTLNADGSISSVTETYPSGKVQVFTSTQEFVKSVK